MKSVRTQRKSNSEHRNTNQIGPLRLHFISLQSHFDELLKTIMGISMVRSRRGLLRLFPAFKAFPKMSNVGVKTPRRCVLYHFESKLVNIVASKCN